VLHFDHYAGTIEAPPLSIVDAFREAFDLTPERRDGLRGYRQRYDLLSDEGRTVAQVLSGGCHPWPHLVSGGDTTDEVVELVRRSWPASHTVARLDSAADFDGPGTWDVLSEVFLSVVDARRIKVYHNGDFHRAEEGRTLYGGGRKSAARVRLYERGKKLLGEGDKTASPDHCRVELQLRPSGEGRKVARAVTPSEAWGFSPWTAELYREYTGRVAPRIETNHRKALSLDQSIDVMTDQWFAKIIELVEREGSGCAAGKMLEKICREKLERRS
jgi:hypothetical protein